MAVRPDHGTGMVLVHLSDVPEAKRVAAADRLIRTGGLAGTAAMMLKMAAIIPRQDPAIEVTVEQWRRVCGPRQRRRP